jgi:hypothetical protein
MFLEPQESRLCSIELDGKFSLNQAILNIVLGLFFMDSDSRSSIANFLYD